jgi:hypothetical protein
MNDSSTAKAHPVFSRSAPAFDQIVLSALKELADARRAYFEAKRGLRAQALSPVARMVLTQAHDRAACKITSARFALDMAIDASEDSCGS